MTAYTPHTPLWRQILSLPHIRLGWLSVGLLALQVGFFIFSSVVFEGIRALEMATPWVLFCGPASIVVGLIAVIWRHERSALVWVAMVLGLAPTPFAIQFVLYLLNSPWYSP
jgi:hypothetical protein